MVTEGKSGRSWAGPERHERRPRSCEQGRGAGVALPRHGPERGAKVLRLSSGVPGPGTGRTRVRSELAAEVAGSTPRDLSEGTDRVIAGVRPAGWLFARGVSALTDPRHHHFDSFDVYPRAIVSLRLTPWMARVLCRRDLPRGRRGLAWLEAIACLAPRQHGYLMLRVHRGG